MAIVNHTIDPNTLHPQNGVNAPDYERRVGIIGQQMLDDRGYLQHLDFITGQSFGALSAKDSKEIARHAETEALMERRDFELTNYGFFSAQNAVSMETIRYFLGRPYSQQDKADIIEQGLKPYANPKLRKFALTFLGEMYGTETEWRTMAVDPSDAYAAEAANHLLLWVAQKNKYRNQKFKMFRDGIIAGRGVMGVRMNPKDLFGEIEVKRYRFQEFMWDISSGQDDVTDSRYLGRYAYTSRDQLAIEFPEYADELSTLGYYGSSYIQTNLDTLIRPETTGLTNQWNSPGYQHDLYGQYHWRDLIMRVEFYRRRQIWKYRVIDGYKKKYIDFDQEQDAQEYMQNLYGYYAKMLYQMGGDPDQGVSVSYFGGLYVDVVDQTLWVGDRLLRVRQSNLNSFPYDHYIPEMYEGNIVSLMESGKDLERLNQRALTRIDHASGGVKSKPIYNVDAIPQDYTEEEWRERLMSETEPIGVRVPMGGHLEDAVTMLPAQIVPEGAKMLLEVAKEGVFEMFGGQNMVGDQVGAQESGKAVLARQAAANLMTLPHFQALRDVDREIGKRVLAHCPMLDPSVRRMVIRGSRPEYFSLWEQGVESIGDFDFELEVVETAASPSNKERIVSQLSNIVRQDPTSAPFVTPVIMKYIDVDQSLIDEVTQGREAKEKSDMVMQQAQMEHEQYIERTKTDLLHLNAQVRLEELKLQQANLAKFNITGKLEDLAPNIAAEILKQTGNIKADPLAIAGGHAVQALTDISKQGMEQRQFNALELERKKSERAAGFDPDQKSKKQGVDTPKDKKARSNKKVNK